MGQQVTKMMPGSLACMCVIISDVVALFIFVMFFDIAPHKFSILLSLQP